MSEKKQFKIYASIVLIITAWIVIEALLAIPDSGIKTKSWSWIPQGWTPPLVSIIVWSLGFASLILIPRYPLWGVFIYVMLMYGFPRYSPSLGYMYNHWFPEWIALLTGIGFILWQKSRKFTGDILHSWIFRLLILLVVWSLISTFFAFLCDRFQVFEIKHHPTRYVNAFILFLVTARLLTSRKDFHWFTLVLGFTLTLRAVLFPDKVYLDGDLGELFIICLPLCYYAALNAQSWASRILFGFLSANFLRLLYLTQNRGAGVAFAIVLVVMWLLSIKKWTILVMVIPLIIGGTIAFKSTGYWGRFKEMYSEGKFRGSASNRITLWRNASKVLQNNRIMGVGPGNATDYLYRYVPVKIRGSAMHNNVLAVLVELGIVGFFLYIFFWLGSVIKLVSLTRGTSKTWPAPEARSVCVAIAAYHVAGIFITRHDQALAFILAAMALGFVAAGKIKNLDESENKLTT